LFYLFFSFFEKKIKEPKEKNQSGLKARLSSEIVEKMSILKVVHGLMSTTKKIPNSTFWGMSNFREFFRSL